MPPKHVNEGEVDRRQARLREEYTDIDFEEETVELPPEKFEDAVEISRRGYIGGGYVWVVRRSADAPPLGPTMPEEAGDDRDRVLMILGRGAGRWGLAGGGLEGDESFEDAAVREVREETDIECSIAGCFLVRRITTVPEERDGRELHTLQAFFDGVYESGEIAIQELELNGAAWFARPPARMLPANEFRAETWFDG